MRYPDFFVGGVPRAGTTSLHYRLADVAEVSMPIIKEPRFFELKDNVNLNYEGPGDVSKKSRYVATEEEYENLFNPLKKLWGDATPTYFHSKKALENIRELCSEPKFIFVLRDPVDRAFSHYMQNVSSGNESLDFISALRQSGKRVRNLGWHLTWDICGYSLYTQRAKCWVDAFGRESILFVRYEDLHVCPLDTWLNIADFLGVDSGDQGVGVFNSSGEDRSRILRTVLQFITRYKRFLAKVVPTIIWSRSQILFHKIKNMNKVKLEDVSCVERAAALEFFIEDIESLEVYLNWDLTSWKADER